MSVCVCVLELFNLFGLSPVYFLLAVLRVDAYCVFIHVHFIDLNPEVRRRAMRVPNVRKGCEVQIRERRRAKEYEAQIRNRCNESREE